MYIPQYAYQISNYTKMSYKHNYTYVENFNFAVVQ